MVFPLFHFHMQHQPTNPARHAEDDPFRAADDDAQNDVDSRPRSRGPSRAVDGPLSLDSGPGNIFPKANDVTGITLQIAVAGPAISHPQQLPQQNQQLLAAFCHPQQQQQPLLGPIALAALSANRPSSAGPCIYARGIIAAAPGTHHMGLGTSSSAASGTPTPSTTSGQFPTIACNNNIGRTIMASSGKDGKQGGRGGGGGSAPTLSPSVLLMPPVAVAVAPLRDDIAVGSDSDKEEEGDDRHCGGMLRASFAAAVGSLPLASSIPRHMGMMTANRLSPDDDAAGGSSGVNFVDPSVAATKHQVSICESI